jgi:diaminopimelate epimerase
MRFEKWQALGNDYLIVEAEQLDFELTAPRVRRLCDPHFGVGSDGVLLLARSTDPAYVASVRIFNPDGSESGMSGNGTRQAIMYLRRHGWTDAQEFSLLTPAGPVRPRITGPDTCRVQLGRASTASADFPGGPADGRGRLSAGGREWSFQHVAVGNPQCAIELDSAAELGELELSAYGPQIERNGLFPNRTNVSWWTRLGDGSLRARIFERGVGETLSSGTGASGVAVAYVLAGGTTPVAVRLDGGELEVDVDGELEVTLSGWARPVFAGELSTELIEELHETE